jgi:hypothetical protein
MVCVSCKQGNCRGCVDVTRAALGREGTICKCLRQGHDGEPRNEQILDPESGTVYAPGLHVTQDGDVNLNKEEQ